VVLTASNTVDSVSGSALGGFSLFDTGPLDVGDAGITSPGGSIALQTTTGSITQTGPVRGLALFADSAAGGEGAGDVLLDNPNNAVGTLAGGATGTFRFANNNGLDLAIGTVNYFISTATPLPGNAAAFGVSAFGLDAPAPIIQISNVGNLVFDPADPAFPDIPSIQSFDPAGLIPLVATRNFINNFGPGAIVESAIDPWQIYSASPTGDFFNGLDSHNTAIWNTTFGEPVTAAGNRYVFAFQPTITVASGDLTKSFGQDVASLVASDFTISGLQPGVGGAFLGDTAAAVYGGTPGVTSLGSPASASVAGSPYLITVARGSFTVSDGYALDLNSAGHLTVAPKPVAFLPFDPGFLPGLTKINNPAQTEYDVGGYEQVLPHFTADCNEPPSLPDPNAYSDPDAALRAISQAMENYFRRCRNPTQATIADALDAYAAKLQVLAPRLPPALRNVPAIIAQAAKRVRAAPTRAAAVAVLRQTVAEVHKEIALVLSEDPQTRSREVRDGDLIAGALGDANVALVNSGGL
jgi:hypothetical protein